MRWKTLSIITMALSFVTNELGLERTTAAIDRVTGAFIYLERLSRWRSA